MTLSQPHPRHARRSDPGITQRASGPCPLSDLTLCHTQTWPGESHVAPQTAATPSQPDTVTPRGPDEAAPTHADTPPGPSPAGPVTAPPTCPALPELAACGLRNRGLSTFPCRVHTRPLPCHPGLLGGPAPSGQVCPLPTAGTGPGVRGALLSHQPRLCRLLGKSWEVGSLASGWSPSFPSCPHGAGSGWGRLAQAFLPLPL